MFEVYYKMPKDLLRETKITRAIAQYGGWLDFREEPSLQDISQAVCLTYVFTDFAKAKQAAESVQQLGERVENLQEYG